MRVAMMVLLVLAGLLPLASMACTMAASGVNFGPIDPLQGRATTGVGQVQIRCPADTPYSVRLSTGAAGTWDRRMASGSDLLSYNLFRDPGHQEVWGDGSGGSLMVSGTGSGDVQAHYLYGRIPAQPAARVGHYLDHIVITLEF